MFDSKELMQRLDRINREVRSFVDYCNLYNIELRFETTGALAGDRKNPFYSVTARFTQEFCSKLSTDKEIKTRYKLSDNPLEAQ